jgi:hypothetical protein
MVKKQIKTVAPPKNRTLYAILFIIIATALIVQVVVLFPLLILSLPTMYAASQYGAISTVLSEILMFLIFIGAMGVLYSKYHGN